MKYIDAEKLIAEIGSRMEDCKLPDGTFPTTTNIVRYEELSCLRNFITSLRQEQPEVDLEDEIDRVIADYSFTKTIDSGGLKTTVLDYEKIARHFAEWGADHFRDTTEMVSDDLEKAAEEYAYTNWEDNDYHEGASEGLPFDAIGHTEKCFIAGAEWQSKRDQDTIKTAEDHAFLAGSYWQKEQMVENAVEGEVVKDISNKLAVTAKNINLDGFKFGDKVRVIIVKEG